MNINLLFESEEEKIATERVLAAFKVKSLNKNIDEYISDILNYAKDIDNLLEENNFNKRYLDRVSTINEESILELDDDLNNLNFRVKEVIEDLIKRINTRISLIKDSDSNLNDLEQRYDINNINLDEEIKKAKLTEEYFA